MLPGGRTILSPSSNLKQQGLLALKTGPALIARPCARERAAVSPCISTVTLRASLASSSHLAPSLRHSSLARRYRPVLPTVS
ncbi:hypothetical protein PUN28_017594 [Cardiocondyla obscurior]|uniref:Uncharacterized protein n=1 Tax=Cardiocondyla obscurior TaxID=286306 RepID=A0AAW2ENL4_9HYME